MKRRFRQLITKLKELLVAGMTAEKWAASACFGLIAALFPVIGPVTMVSIVVCWLARLNLPLVLVLLYGLYPVQLALILPFTWLGSQFTGWHLPVDFGMDDILQFSGRLGEEAIQWGSAAILGWSMVVFPLGLGIYPLLLRYARKIGRTTA